MPPKKNTKKRAATDRNDNRKRKAPKTGNSSGPKRDVSWVVPPEEARGQPPYPFNEEAALGFAQELFGEEYSSLHNCKEKKSVNYKPNLGSPVRSATDGKPNPRFKQHPKSQAYERLYREIQNATGNPFDLGVYAFHQFVQTWIDAQKKQGAVIAYPGKGPFVTAEAADISVIGDEDGAESKFRLFRATHSETQNQEFFIRLKPGNTITVNENKWTCKDDEGTVTIGPLTPYTAIEIQSQPIFFWKTSGALFGKIKGDINLTNSEENRGLDGNDFDDGPIKWRAASEEEVVNTRSASKSAGSVVENAGNGTGITQVVVELFSLAPLKAAEFYSIGTAQEAPGPSVNVDAENSTAEDPCTYFRKRVDGLSSHTKLQIQPIKHTLGYKDIFNAVASVTQAVSSLYTDNKKPDHCFAHIDFKTAEQVVRDGNPTTNFQVLYPERPLIVPWRTSEDHTFLVVARRKREVIGLTVLDTAPWFIDANWRQTTLERLQTLLKHSRYAKNIKELEELKRGPIIWITPSPTDEKWKAECFTILHAWAFALGLDLNPEFQGTNLSDFFYKDFRQLLAIVLQGLADWRLIWSFLRCKEIINDSQVARDDRITKTISSENIDSHMLELKTKAGPEGRIGSRSARTFGFPREYRQPYPGDFITDNWTEQDIKAWPERFRNQDTQEKDQQHARQVVPKEIPSKKPSPCDEFRKKLNERLSNESIINDLNNNLKTQSHIWKEYEYVDALEVSNAILCVLMAINANAVSDGRFNFVVSDDVQTVRDKGELIYTTPRRNGQPLFYAWTECGHHVLHVIQYENGVPTISILDSMRIFPTHYRNRMYEGAMKIMKKLWLLDETPALPTHANYVACAKQNGKWCCGFHTILNAWALALGLDINPNFERPHSDWTRRGSRENNFISDLYYVVRLAQLGEADWSLIASFLQCYEYVQPDGNVPQSRQFNQTHRLITLDDVYNYIADMSLSDAIYNSLRTSDPTLPEIWPGKVNFPYKKRINRQDYYLAGDSVHPQHVLHGIASVVEAIDLFQKNDYLTRHQKEGYIPPFGENELGIFSGGFALASWAAIEPTSGQNSTSQPPNERQVSRPRRCWLLPRYRKDSRGKTWHYLAILQEEYRPGNMDFKIYIAHSSATQSDVDKATSNDAFMELKGLADRLSWSTHRNPEGKVEFSPNMTCLPVGKHRQWSESGARTIINAWIYALGLRPNPDKNSLGQDELEEFYGTIDQAVGGRLSWKNIFEFLRGSNHILETSPDAVPHNRRFTRTVDLWRTGQDEGLDERLHGSEGQYETDDVPLSEIEFEDYAYDHGNNLTWEQRNPMGPNRNGELRREMEITDESDYHDLPNYHTVKVEFEMDRAKKERKNSLSFLEKWQDSGLESPLFS